MRILAICVLFACVVFAASACGGGGGGTPIVPGDGTAGTLEAPTDVAASDGLLTDRVRITWKHPASALTPNGYKIYRTHPPTEPEWVLIGTVLYVTVFDDLYVVPDETYRYVVVSYKKDYADSAFSNEDTGFRQ